MLNIQTRKDGNAVVVILQGKADFKVFAHLRDAIRDAVATPRYKVLVFNFEFLTFIDSCGLALLVVAQKSVVERGGEFRLCCLPPQIKKIFDRTNFTNYFSIFPTEKEALMNLVPLGP